METVVVEEPEFLAGFVFGVGSREAAVALRAPIYEKELGSSGIDAADDKAVHLVANDRLGRVCACLRLELADCRPFSIESFVDLSTVVRPDAAVAEVSRFVVHPDARIIRRDQFVHLGMLKLVLDFSYKMGLTDLVTLSLPHLNKLYELALFQKLGPARSHSVWGLVQPMHVNLARARERAATIPNRFASLLFESTVSNVQL